MCSRFRVLCSSGRAGAPSSPSQSPWFVFHVKCFWLATNLTTVILSATAALGAQLELRQVAFSSEMPAGMPSGNLFQGFAEAPVIDNLGHVAFLAELGPGSAASSVWFDSNAGLRNGFKVRIGAATGAAFDQFSDIVIADGGVIAFKATLTGTTIGDDNRESIWLIDRVRGACCKPAAGAIQRPTFAFRTSKPRLLSIATDKQRSLRGR